MMAQWSPYIAGALVGVLAILSVVVTTSVLHKAQYLGASTTYVRAAGIVEQVVEPEHVAQNAYFQKEKVKVDWQMMFVGGIFLGALAASLLGRTAKIEWAPPVWRERFGANPLIRAVGAFIGGFILLFGARLAGGCPSGHGLSGNMQLSVSSLLALVFFIVGALLTARQLYGSDGKGGL
ncbi:MAG: YeeE/YedE family protein [Desulfuromonadaceae bacterium]|nr:YeeE/YedE family protein [Desulfuromonadaceae bacterium]